MRLILLRLNEFALRHRPWAALIRAREALAQLLRAGIRLRAGAETVLGPRVSAQLRILGLDIAIGPLGVRREPTRIDRCRGLVRRLGLRDGAVLRLAPRLRLGLWLTPRPLLGRILGFGFILLLTAFECGVGTLVVGLAAEPGALGCLLRDQISLRQVLHRRLVAGPGVLALRQPRRQHGKFVVAHSATPSVFAVAACAASPT